VIPQKAISALRTVRERARQAWLRTRFELRWRYGQNAASRRQFRRQRPVLGLVQRRVVHDLCALGIAFARFDELGVDQAEWQRLRRTADEFSRGAQVSEAIRGYAAAASNPRVRFDAYLVKLHPEGPALPLDDPLLRIGLEPAVLDAVNAYLGLWAKLIYTDVWHSIPVDAEAGRRIGSQHWHRDPEDRRMIKIYLYFSDVHAGAGPLEYVRGSASTGSGPYRALWPWRPRGDRYPPDEALERRIPAAERLSCVGAPGTIIFCDTNGFHRGGIATTGVRLVATWTFVTPAAMAMLSPRRFHVPDLDRGQIPQSPAARFAVT
jgi:hypothetical protein